MLEKLCSYLRIYEWYDSKVPFMLAVFLYFENMEKTYDVRQCYKEIIVYALYVSMFLAFSYVVNDFSDRKIDIAAGKKKVMHGMPTAIVILSLAVICSLGTVPFYFVVDNRLEYLVMTAGIYLCGVAYSAPGLRFKEKGIWGLIECSTAQRCLPLLPILLIHSATVLQFALFFLVSFVNGLRYILIHQVLDLENDLRTGVKTFISNGNTGYRFAVRVCLLVEIGLLGILYLTGLFRTIGMAVFLIAYIGYEWIIFSVVTKYMQRDWECSFLAVPLEDLYNVFLPIVTAVFLTITDVRYLGILIGLCFIVMRCFLGKSAFIKVYFTKG